MPVDTATVSLGSETQPISPLMFGGFIEHFGRIIYDGLWDLDRQAPNEAVLAAVRTLRPTILRYPGGCFADSYHWRDGIGPRDRRPHYEETFWTQFVHWLGLDDEWAPRFGPPEPNAFGTDEFLAYSADVGAAPAITANVGTGTPDEAAEWVAYTGGRVKTWFLGNELWGGHEYGHLPAPEYGKRVVEFAEAMRAVDPDITLIPVGAMTGQAADSAAWNAAVLAEAGDTVDVLSLHHYFPGPDHPGRSLRDDEGDYAQLAAGSIRLGLELDKVLGSTSIPISLDEWNVWAHWPELVEANHRICDAMVVAGGFNRLIERAGRIHSAMLSQLVNCMAPIQTRGADMFVTATYLAALLYRDHAGSEAVRTTVECGDFAVPPFADAAGGDGFVTLATSSDSGVERAPIVDAAATRRGRDVAIFVTNRSIDAAVSVVLSGVSPSGELVWIDADSPFACNDVDHPDRLRFRRRPVDTSRFELPPHTIGVVLTTDARGVLPRG
jgi:alpha-N-arabinofuranosidase